MTVLPGSLDYLYYNGILDHIPYEAYEMAPYQQMNGSQYLNMAMQGNAFNTYTGQDTFVQRNIQQSGNSDRQSFMQKAYGINDGVGRDYNFKSKAYGINDGIGSEYDFKSKAYGINDGVGSDYDLEEKAYGKEGKSFRETLTNAAKSTAEGYSNAPIFVKGLIAGGVIIGTLVCLLKGKKKPPVKTSTGSFWSKLNPRNWFKKSN